MISRILALELGNDKGLYSFKNLKKLFYMYIVPNLSVVISAVIFGLQRFYDPKGMILAVLGINLLVAVGVQFYAQRNVLSKLNTEALLKFIPEKTAQFIKTRLLFFVIKFQLPIFIFTITFLSFFIEGIYFGLLLFILILLLINLQISGAIWIRYWTNTWRRLTLQTWQVILFLGFISFISWFSFSAAEPVLESLENILMNREAYSLYQIDPSHISIIISIVAVISVASSLFINRINFKILMRNRDLSFELKTRNLERILVRIYGFGLSKIQKILFEKDIKHLIRHSKVTLVMHGLMHLIYIGMMTFFFLDFSEINLEIFMSRFYFVYFLIFIIFNGFILMPNKEYTGFENDLDVAKSYHINISKSQLVHVKTRLLQAIVFPKLTIIYAGFVITLLILGEYTVSLIYFINYWQLLIFVKAWSLWVVKSANQMNHPSELISYINFGLILAFFILLGQALSRPIESLFIFQGLVLLMLIVLYCFHLFINKDFKKFKSNEGVE